MKRTTKLSLYTTAVALICAASTAQEQATTNASPGASSSAPSSAGSADPQLWKTAQKQEFFRASSMIGKKTQDNKGQKIGDIKDIVFNQQGEVFALVDVGNSRWAALPWQLVQPRSAKGEDPLTLDSSAQAIKSAPVVTKDQWGALNNPSFSQGIYSYFKLQSPSAPATAVGGSSEPGGTSQGQGGSQDQSSSATQNTNQSSSQGMQPGQEPAPPEK
jgi:hypothetical protein